MTIGVIFIASFFWALLSLKKELSRPKEIDDAKKDLERERVIFRA